ncbi:hypothetical protein V6N11_020781 [Hibiscus sabdariffa]|uniref:Uncharacterized protein n=1 Tax=Hibiscus sabdariffa TaxID=183260 RepID=A0ABR2Q9G1_9ROSI
MGAKDRVNGNGIGKDGGKSSSESFGESVRRLGPENAVVDGCLDEVESFNDVLIGKDYNDYVEGTLNLESSQIGERELLGCGSHINPSMFFVFGPFAALGELQFLYLRNLPLYQSNSTSVHLRKGSGHVLDGMLRKQAQDAGLVRLFSVFDLDEPTFLVRRSFEAWLTDAINILSRYDEGRNMLPRGIITVEAELLW